MDLSTVKATLQASFVCPDNLTGLVLVMHDEKGTAREYSSSPNWPLTLRIEVRQAVGGRSVLTTTVDKAALQFTNWHGRSTSVLLKPAPRLADTLAPGTTYLIRIEVDKPCPDLGKAEVFLHWLGR